MNRLFRLVWIRTTYEDRYDDHSMERINFEYIGDRDSIYSLWLELNKLGYKHLTIYDIEGNKMDTDKGINGLHLNNF